MRNNVVLGKRQTYNGGDDVRLLIVQDRADRGKVRLLCLHGAHPGFRYDLAFALFFVYPECGFDLEKVVTEIIPVTAHLCGC